MIGEGARVVTGGGGICKEPVAVANPRGPGTPLRTGLGDGGFGAGRGGRGEAARTTAEGGGDSVLLTGGELAPGLLQLHAPLTDARAWANALAVALATAVATAVELAAAEPPAF